MDNAITRRTLEAAKHADGSTDRARLNLRAETSEYMPSHRYMIRDGDYARTFRTRAEAAAWTLIARMES